MRNEITIQIRNFPVVVWDHRDSTEKAITVPVSRDQLRAAQAVFQSSKELIERLCSRQGYTPISIGTPDRQNITIDLAQLVEDD